MKEWCVKNNNSEECRICHYFFFNDEFKFQNFVGNGCHNLTMFCLNISNVAIITVTGVDYPCIIHEIAKSEAIHLLENYALNYRGYI